MCNFVCFPCLYLNMQAKFYSMQCVMPNQVLFNQNSSCTEILKFASVPYFLVYKVYKMPSEFSDLLFSW